MPAKLAFLHQLYPIAERVLGLLGTFFIFSLIINRVRPTWIMVMYALFRFLSTVQPEGGSLRQPPLPPYPLPWAMNCILLLTPILAPNPHSLLQNAYLPAPPSPASFPPPSLPIP